MVSRKSSNSVSSLKILTSESIRAHFTSTCEALLLSFFFCFPRDTVRHDAGSSSQLDRFLLRDLFKRLIYTPHWCK